MAIAATKMIEVAKIPLQVRELVDRHRNTWAGHPTSYWFYRLVEEVGELGSSLADHHEHPIELELAEIASICINWLKRIERENEKQ